MHTIYTDVLVIGGGLAGQRAAIGARRRGQEVIVLSLVPAKRSHSAAAQGGMQASLGNCLGGAGDNEDIHFADTVRGSDWGADQEVVRMFTHTAPKAIRELAAWGVPWNRVQRGEREITVDGKKQTITEADAAHGLITARNFGGTQKWRACYVSDGTGHAMLYTMSNQAIAAGIPVHERMEALALIHDGGRCHGAIVRNLMSGELVAYVARATCIATGGFGRIYRQFSVTIISAIVLSTLTALILSPAMTASMLRPEKPENEKFIAARLFDRVFDFFRQQFLTLNARFLRRALLSMVILLAIGGAVYLLFARIPGSFLPQEDQGILMAMVTLPEHATVSQTRAVVERMESYLLEKESGAVKTVFASMGFSFGGTAQNKAMCFISLKDFDERAADPSLSSEAVAQRANAYFMQHNRQGTVMFMQPPAIPGMGNTGGFSMYLVDQAGNGQAKLLAAADKLVATANADGRITNLRGNEQQTRIAMRIDIDQHKAKTFGLSLSDINAMLYVIFSGSEVNDFQMNSELRPVIVQGEAGARMQPDVLNDWYAANSDDKMVPFSAFTTLAWEELPSSLDRYGGTRALSLSGAAAEGVSSGDAMTIMETLTRALDGYGVAWTGLSYQERLSGTQAPLLYAVSILVVFLALAALYESWSIPFAILLIVPVGILGALLGALAFDQSNDVYFKIGILATIGLAAKNAILVVEFAVELQRGGMAATEAVLEAARQRFRPILMTALTFILGVMPLAFASGAGAAAQNAIGIAVLFGMIASTFIGVFLVPALLISVQKIFRIDYAGPRGTPDER